MFLLAGIVYSLLYNDGRWVMEMNLEEYVFSAKDIPMLAAGMPVALYAVYIAVVICRESPQRPFHTKGPSSELHPPGAALSRCIRNIRPFGLFRLLDISCARHCLPISSLCPVWAVRAVFFEGKLSHTLEDELFQQNKARADLKAYKTGFLLLVAVILLSRWRVLALHAEWCAIFLLISVSLIVAFVLFQKRYLLYCYEKEE